MYQYAIQLTAHFSDGLSTSQSYNLTTTDTIETDGMLKHLYNALDKFKIAGVRRATPGELEPAQGPNQQERQSSLTVKLFSMIPSVGQKLP